jgi:hypothetical protein
VQCASLIAPYKYWGAYHVSATAPKVTAARGVRNVPVRSSAGQARSAPRGTLQFASVIGVGIDGIEMQVMKARSGKHIGSILAGGFLPKQRALAFHAPAIAR